MTGYWQRKRGAVHPPRRGPCERDRPEIFCVDRYLLATQRLLPIETSVLRWNTAMPVQGIIANSMHSRFLVNITPGQ